MLQENCDDIGLQCIILGRSARLCPFAAMVESAFLSVVERVHVNLLSPCNQVLYHGFAGEGSRVHECGHSSHVAAVQIWPVGITAYHPGKHASAALRELLYSWQISVHSCLQHSLHLQKLGHELYTGIAHGAFSDSADEELALLRDHADPALNPQAFEGACRDLHSPLADGAELHDGDDGPCLQVGFGLAVQGLADSHRDLGLHLVLPADLKVV
mmetsp:Transcript_58707/g.171811  ORF Transcript_58707/g.171811 Transcript_58707/m.171811 type:complete len:214 (+) Transcript_58707:661-1302(+)